MAFEDDDDDDLSRDDIQRIVGDTLANQPPPLAAPSDSLLGGSPQEIAGRLGMQAIPEPLNRGAMGLRALLEESLRIQQRNQSNLDQARDFTRAQFDQNTVPTMTQEDMNSIFAQEATALSGDFLSNNDAIAESIGLRGVSGGIAADLAAQSRADFRSALAQAKGNVRIAKIQADANDRMRNLNAAFSLGNFLAQGEDETGLYGFERFIEGTLGIGSIAAQERAASKAAKASKQSGLLGLAGSVLGGIL